MDIVLSPQLLQFLILQGYRYCLSKNSRKLSDDLGVICIILRPVRLPPMSIRLPDDYDEYYMISEEPRRLANGIDGVLTLVNLDKITLLAYIASVAGVLKINDQDQDNYNPVRHRHE